MKTFPIRVFLWFFLAAAATAPAVAADSISLQDYQRQLAGIRQSLDSQTQSAQAIAGLIRALPDRVRVSTSSGERQVNFVNLKDDLSVLSRSDPEERPAKIEQLQKYVDSLQAEARSFSDQRDLSSARSSLNEILARREFHNVQGPTAKDIWLGRLYNWLQRVLGRMFRIGSSSAVSYLIYVAVGLAFLLLAYWGFRRLRRRPEETFAREIIPFSPSSRSWRAWLAEGRQSADGGDWRNAIHLSYWAGISFLEEHGAWKPNRARTPREYLRLIRTGRQREHHTPLSALTRKFELVWYGQRDAREADFHEILLQLEKIGCR